MSRFNPLALMLALMPAVPAAHAQPVITQETASGGFVLSGSALDPLEARRLPYASSRLAVALPAQGGGWLAFESRWLLTGNRVGADSYNASLLGAVRVVQSYGPLRLGLLGGFLHTEQGLDRMRSSRRAFYGLSLGADLKGGHRVAFQTGWLHLKGGLDGRGRDSLSDARFSQLAFDFRLSARMRLKIEATGAAGIMDFDTAPASGVGITRLALTLTRATRESRAHWYLRLGRSRYQRAGGATLTEDRLTLGFRQNLGRTRGAPPPRIAPLEDFVAQTGGPLK